MPLPTHRTASTQNKSTQTPKPRVRFEPMNPVFEHAKTGLDGAATVIGYNMPTVHFFLYYWGGTFDTAATTGLLYQLRMIGEGDCGETCEIKTARGNRSTWRKPAPAPLCPPQIPHD
jgi:hypothetical protein